MSVPGDFGTVPRWLLIHTLIDYDDLRYAFLPYESEPVPGSRIDDLRLVRHTSPIGEIDPSFDVGVTWHVRSTRGASPIGSITVERLPTDATLVTLTTSETIQATQAEFWRYARAVTDAIPNQLLPPIPRTGDTIRSVSVLRDDAILVDVAPAFNFEDDASVGFLCHGTIQTFMTFLTQFSDSWESLYRSRRGRFDRSNKPTRLTLMTDDSEQGNASWSIEDYHPLYHYDHVGWLNVGEVAPQRLRVVIASRFAHEWDRLSGYATAMIAELFRLRIMQLQHSEIIDPPPVRQLVAEDRSVHRPSNPKAPHPQTVSMMERREALKTLLDSGNTFTKAGFASKWKVTPRTIHNDVKAIQEDRAKT